MQAGPPVESCVEFFASRKVKTKIAQIHTYSLKTLSHTLLKVFRFLAETTDGTSAAHDGHDTQQHLIQRRRET